MSDGNGGTPASRTMTVIGSVYLILLSIVLLYCLYEIWPHPSPTGGGVPPASETVVTEPTVASPVSSSAGSPPAAGASGSSAPTQPLGQQPPSSVTAAKGQKKPVQRQSQDNGSQPLKEPASEAIFGLPIIIFFEQRLLLIVILTGALGACVHAIRSFAWYVGNRELVGTWALRYITLPIVGALLAVVFYVVVRGGFFAGDANFRATSPFGFAAMAALVGMFSEQAVVKLKEVAENLFASPGAGKDSKPQPPDPTPAPRKETGI